jgi:hypothetical protein
MSGNLLWDNVNEHKQVHVPRLVLIIRNEVQRFCKRNGGTQEAEGALGTIRIVICRPLYVHSSRQA